MNMCDKFARENPSFSSTLLDSIYRSIDESSSKSESDTTKPNQDLFFHKETTMKKKKKQTKYSRNEFCIDLMLLNSSSTSSDCSSGGGFSISSSDSDSFNHTTTSKSRPKPIRTHQVVEKNTSHGGTSSEKSKAFKIYSELKKVKQPISPGAKLTSFINSIFNSNSKKTKKTTMYEEKITSSRTCFSASSFSRSCLSMRTKGGTRTTQRSVRFCLDDEDSMSRQHEQIKTAKHGRMECHTSKELDYNVLLNNYRKMKNEATASVAEAVNEYDDDDYDDVASYASSDLFELDHLRAIDTERYLEELPVYETTHFDTNRSIANGLIM